MCLAARIFANANFSNLNEFLFVVTNGFNLRELLSADADVPCGTDLISRKKEKKEKWHLLTQMCPYGQFFIKNFRNLRNWLSADADVPCGTNLFLSRILRIIGIDIR